MTRCLYVGGVFSSIVLPAVLMFSNVFLPPGNSRGRVAETTARTVSTGKTTTSSGEIYCIIKNWVTV